MRVPTWRRCARAPNWLWVINGQKIWSTGAHQATHMFVLARTEPDMPTHDGISYLSVDLRQPGVTIRPLTQMTGQKEFCEVFFDNARTPAGMLVGERGKGWYVTRSTLKHERSGVGGLTWPLSMFRDLLKVARTVERNGRPAISGRPATWRSSSPRATASSRVSRSPFSTSTGAIASAAGTSQATFARKRRLPRRSPPTLFAEQLFEAYLVPMFERSIGCASRSKAEHDAGAIFRHVRRLGPPTINVREISRTSGLGVGKAKDVEAAFGVLVRAGVIRHVGGRAGGGPGCQRKDYEVNPLVLNP